jgi:hypothetical protein
MNICFECETKIKNNGEKEILLFFILLVSE